MEIDFEELASSDRESDFVKASFDLLRECAQYCGVAACLLPREPGGWDADRAVLCGLMARLAKLLHGVLGYGAQDRRELVMVLTRCAFESTVNLRFMLANFSPAMLRSYRSYSLRHERQLRDEILENIDDRDGAVLPIERRMLASIDKAFKHAGLDPAEVDPTERGNWGGRSIYGKSVDVDLQWAYLSLFGGGSHVVHGNWQDLIDHHLDEEEGLYIGNPEFHRSRPQLFEAIGLIVVETLRQYFEFFDYDWPEAMKGRFEALENNLVRVSHEHEQYLRRTYPQYESEAGEGGCS